VDMRCKANGGKRTRVLVGEGGHVTGLAGGQEGEARRKRGASRRDGI